MPLSAAMLEWLTPPHDWSTPHSSPAPPPAARPDNSASPTSTSTPPIRKRARVSAVVDVDQMAKDGFFCCKRLRCVQSFVAGEADIKTLRAEQAALATLSGRARSDFVHSMVPLVSPDKGAMVAGREIVCTAFFRRAFNVSNNMIQALKNNPGSPAMKG